ATVGATGFEPATSCSRSRRATGLRYAPKNELSPLIRGRQTHHNTHGHSTGARVFGLIAVCNASRKSQTTGQKAYICDISKYRNDKHLVWSSGLEFVSFFRVASGWGIASYR